MVSGNAAHDAVARARGLPSLKVGLHLVLVEGRPVLPPSAVPDLVGPDGRFRRDMLIPSVAIFALPRVRRQVEAEIAAQFEAFLATGLALDHVDAHKHFHLHPTLARLVCRVGERYGMRALRAPVEPADVVAEVDRSSGRRLQGGPAELRAIPLLLTSRFASRLARRLSDRGIVTADHVFGVAWSGALRRERLAGLIDRLPSGVSEVYCHPATSDAFAGAASGYRYREELAALLSPDVAAAVARHGVALTTYSHLHGSGALGSR
jgi:hopanoid biosynthesis associated protein HpnK